MAKQKNNPRNPGSKLFQQLTRLFSGPLINYRSQTTRRLKRRRLDKYGSRFKDVGGQNFKRLEYNPFDNLAANIMSTHGRVQRYMDFDQMEYTPEINSSLDIYADEMTTSNDLRQMLTIHCDNEEIKHVLQNLYHNVMNVNSNMFGWCRTTCKYGDFFLYLDIDDSMGIINAIGLPGGEIERIEGEDKSNPNYIQFQWNSGGLTLENWQISHFRILGNDKYAPYGTSILEPARRIWRQLTLLEDSMMAYRIVRAPERRVFYVDVGNINAEDVDQHMQHVISSMKRNKLVDSTTGKVDLRHNPMGIDEDFFIPVRGDRHTRIESLPGGTYTGDIDDVKYLRDKLFSALKVPQSYLSRGEGSDEDKTTLAQKDIRFARTVQRLQRVCIEELEKIGIIHLYVLGYKGDDLLSFTLSLNNPSKIAELQELEHWRTKFDVAAAATDGFFSRRWIAANLLGVSDEEFERCQRELFSDAKFQTTLDSIGQEESDAMGLGGGAGGGGELGLGLDDIPASDEDDFDLGSIEGGPEGGEDIGGEDETLLAAPGRRKEGYTTPGAKGKVYHPTKTDSRGIGARTRSTKSQWSDESKGRARRNKFAGESGIRGLSRGIFQETATNYFDREELKLRKNRFEVKRLFESLDEMEKNKDMEKVSDENEAQQEA